MALAHQIADLRQKHAQTGKTQVDTLLAAAKIPQAAQQTLHTAHQTHNMAVTTNRLMQTPIPATRTDGRRVVMNQRCGYCGSHLHPTSHCPKTAVAQ